MPGHRDHSRRLKAFAREMRREPTDAERKLWTLLRKHRLSGFRFRRQFPTNGYILDFVCLEATLIIEADGGQHREPSSIAYDDARTKALTEAGFRVLRFSDRDILKDSEVVATMILRALLERTSSSIPSSGTPGEGKGGGSVPSSGTPGEG